MITFASNRPLGRAENITAVYNAWPEEKQYIKINSREGREYFRKATRRDICIADEFTPVTKATTVMIFHGPPGGKTYGVDQPRPYHALGKAPTYIVSSSSEKETMELLSKCSGTPLTRCLPLGFPRTDAYFDETNKGKTPLARYERAYLYTPTFRTNAWLDWPAVNTYLNDGEVLAVKWHPIHKNCGVDLTPYSHIVEMPSNEPSMPYLMDCDVLITNYSSIMFDAHILKKPVVLYDPDRTTYLRKRGMYWKYPDEYASRECQDVKTLVDICRGAKGQNQADIECLNRAANMCDGHSTERVIEFIFSLIKEMER